VVGLLEDRGLRTSAEREEIARLIAARLERGDVGRVERFDASASSSTERRSTGEAATRRTRGGASRA
jgi:hypothetical protein